MEWLGIGLNGSKTAAPGIDAAEFPKAMLHLLRDESIRVKAGVMKDLCAREEGRVVAHDQIVEFAR